MASRIINLRRLCIAECIAIHATTSRVVEMCIRDSLHLVGDIFDRGGGAAKIMDRLLTYHSLDIRCV